MLLGSFGSGEVVQEGMHDRPQADNATCHDKNLRQVSRKVGKKRRSQRRATRSGKRSRRLNGHEEIRHAKRAAHSPVVLAP